MVAFFPREVLKGEKEKKEKGEEGERKGG